MNPSEKILIVSDQTELPSQLDQALSELDLARQIQSCDEALKRIESLTKHEAVVILPESAGESSFRFDSLIDKLDHLSINAMILADEVLKTSQNPWQSLFCVDANESTEMLKGRIKTLVELHPLLSHLNFESQRLNQLHSPLNNYISEVDEEMRLAARLQRDFLPKQLPEIPGFTFATIYRPATWVSGDIYDLMRLDEEHIGFYVCDAVGHGMPAALLTMFIKSATVTKKITKGGYELVDPAEVLRKLNHDLIEQALSNFQFVTGCYGILNTKTLKLRISNAGHPAPILIEDDSSTSELDIGGPLLGVFEDGQFETKEFQLKPGQKLLLFSDGVEVAFVNGGPDEPLRFRKEFDDLGHMDVNPMCERLLEIINSEEGSLHPRDDVTIIGLQIDS